MTVPPKVPVEAGPDNVGSAFRRNNDALTGGIVTRLREGDYCTLLGPKYSQKSYVLQDVKAALEATGERWTCLPVDLREVHADSEATLLDGVAARVSERTGLPTTGPLTSPGALRRYLETCLAQAPGDLALLLDHLEHAPLDAVRALLVVLRALYSAREPHAPQHLVVVIASALSLAPLSIGPTSPFNIAHPFVVADLSPDETLCLIDCVGEQYGVSMSEPARRLLSDRTRGDRHLIPLLCRRCAETAAMREDKCVRADDVNTAEYWFQESRAATYAPLQDTIRALEDQPVHMLNVLRLLEKGSVPRRELELELDLEVDSLQLTGAVHVEETGEERRYAARNPIYEEYLRRHFHQDRVVHVLSISGDWVRAIEYLEEHQPTSPTWTFRTSLLRLLIDAVYAAPNVQVAAEGLAYHAAKAFGVHDVRLYLLDRTRSWLDPASSSNQQAAKPLPVTDLEHPEIRGFVSTHYELVRDNELHSVFIPLRRGASRTFGVLAVGQYPFGPQDVEFLTLMAFAKQIGWALGSVIERERKLQQLKALEESGRRLASSLALEEVLRATVETALTAIEGAQRGLLMLWDGSRSRLVVRSHTGFRPTFAEEVSLERGQGYVGLVFKTGQPVCIANVPEDSRVALPHDPDVAKQRSAAAVPLVAWGRPIGVLCVDNVSAFDVFHEEDEEVLSVFAAQAAVAIQNASVHTELFELGLLINQGETTSHEIFRLTVQRILRVSGASAANMLLLSDTHDPERSVNQVPLLVVSEGLGNDYDVRVRPRSDGMTHAVLRLRRPVAVSRPQETPGLNPLAVERGVQASVCLPMTVQDTILGALFVHFDTEHRFSQNEIETLALFANQCALAISSARQREALRVNAFVAWMGIDLSQRAHDAAQVVAAAQNTLFALAGMGHDRPGLKAKIEETRGYVRKVGELIRPTEAETPASEVVDLNDLVRDELPQWCSSVHLDLSGLATGRAPVRAHPQRLRKALKGMSVNAVRAAKQADQPKVSVSTRVVGGRVELEMHNPGPPIPEAVRERIFREPLTRAQGAAGSGLGLLIVRTILLSYSGDAALVQSDETETVFRLWLPRAAQSETTESIGRE